MEQFSDVISLWSNPTELARDLALPVTTVRSWADRESIPPEHWKGVVANADRRGFEGVSLEVLAEIAAKKLRAA